MGLRSSIDFVFTTVVSLHAVKLWGMVELEGREEVAPHRLLMRYQEHPALRQGTAVEEVLHI